jgi:hypothetical protein
MPRRRMLTKKALYDDPWNAVYLPLPANAPANLLEAARFAAYLVCCNTHPETEHGGGFFDTSDPHLGPVARTRSRIDNYVHALARFQELEARLPAPTSLRACVARPIRISASRCERRRSSARLPYDFRLLAERSTGSARGCMKTPEDLVSTQQKKRGRNLSEFLMRVSSIP